MNKQNDCQKHREAITAFALGELEHRAADELKKHIDTCETCRSLYHALVDEEETIRSVFQAITDRSESLQNSLVKQLDKHDPSVPQIYIRSRKTVKVMTSAIMKSRITKLAAAAVIIIAALIVINQFGSSIDGTTMAFAQITENMKKMPWMHCVVETAGESSEAWISFEQKVIVTKRQSGEIIYRNYLKQTVQIFNPKDKTVSVSYKAGDAFTELSSVLDFPEYVLKLFDEVGGEVIQENSKYLGRDSKIYRARGFLGGMDMKVEMIVDMDKNIILFMNKKVFDNTGKLTEDLSAYFDYPENGPNDIYQAGAPVDTQVKIIDERDPEFLEVIKPYRTARENLPRGIVVETEANTKGTIRTICVVYNDGRKQRFEWIESNETSDNIPAYDSFDSLLTWTSNVKSDSIWIQLYDGEYIYRARRDYEGFWSIREKEYSPKRNHRSYNGGIAYRGWPEYVMYKGKVVENNYSKENSVICIEKHNETRYEGKKLRYPAEKTLYYINPQRGYMCVRKEQFQHRLPPHDDPIEVQKLDFAPDDIPSEPYSITEVIEFGQTDARQWYPKKIRLWSRNRIDRGYGWETSEEIKIITLYLKINPEFPDGIFDPNNLVPTGAKIRKEGEKTTFERYFEQAITVIDSRQYWPEPEEIVKIYWQARAKKDYEEMAILWPGSASWNSKVLENEKPVEYVFGEVRKAGDNRVIVPYAAKSYYEKNGTYNLKMWLDNKKSTKDRYYITSGN